MKSLLASGPETVFRESTAGPEDINVVALLKSDHDCVVLSSVAKTHGWNLHFSDTPEEAWTLLGMNHAPLMLLDRMAPGVDWKDAVRIMASAPHKPCVILLAQVVDHNLIREVMKLGGHDVVSQPLSESSLGLSLRLALRYWASGLRQGARTSSLIVGGSHY